MFVKVEKSNAEMYMLDVERLLQINSLSRTSVDLKLNAYIKIFLKLQMKINFHLYYGNIMMLQIDVLI